MQQVPADRVIAEMATRLGELSRENAILKVQVEILTEAATPAVIPLPASSVEDSTTVP